MANNAFQAAGADKIAATPYAAIHTNRFFTGLWTQRSPLRDAATPYLYEKFYSGSRYDSLIGGVNMELTSRLTLKRRPGHSQYNSFSFAPVNRGYEFRTLNSSGQQVIRVMLDTAATVYDATPASLGANTHATILTKSTGSTATQFQGIGNTLYFGNGIDQKKWVYANTWQANHVYNVGQTILDSNNNLQQASAVETLAFTEVTVNGNVLTLRRSLPWSALQIANLPGSQLLLQNFQAALFLNGQTITVTAVQHPGGGPYTLTASFTHINYGTLGDSGGAYTSSGSASSAGSAPTWATTNGALTFDGLLEWTCKGSAVQNWGAVGGGPSNAPSVANAQGTPVAPNWAATTFYSPSLILFDTNNNIQLLTTAGTTAGAQPAWNVALGGVTNDGSAQWTNQGSGSWAASTSYTAGQYIAVAWSQRIITQTTGPRGEHIVAVHTVNYFDFFICTQSGTTGTGPTWAAGFNSQVSDGSAIWQNVGTVVTWNGATLNSVVTIGVGATTVVTLTQTILDTNGNLQNVYKAGKSAGAAPTWKTAEGALTNETSSTLSWINAGAAGSTANAGTWTYGYAFRNSTTSYDSPMSPESAPIVLSPPTGFNGYISVTGSCPGDPQFDTIRIFRTTQQTSSTGATDVFLQVADIPLTVDQVGNTAAIWSYQDSNPDSFLNFLIEGDITGQNSAPPAGFLPDCYHLQRIWGHVANVVFFTNGPDALNGANGNETLSPSNNYVMPAPVVRIMANALGLFVFTTAGMYTIPGSGTTTDPLRPPKPFLDGKVAGLLNYDALAINGTLLHLMNSKNEVLMIDPSTGVSESGFPIGDILLASYNPASTRVVWHDQNSTDAALYVADGSVGWYRCNPTPAPESGMAWSPQAQIVGGAGFVQSVEISTGVHKLLVQAPGGGAILYRDATNFADNGTTYAANAIVGSLVLAPAGSVALIDFVTIDAMAVGSRIIPSVLLEEISGTFDVLGQNVPDPTDLPTSTTVYGDRWYMATTLKPALCRHMQIKFSIPSENAGNELLTYAIYGTVVDE